jgi:outer membrane protein OmpA-like peptidoglycan-associated protein
MKNKVLFFAIIVGMLLLVSGNVLGQQIEYLDAKPLSQAVSGSFQAFKATGEISLPVITWGGDVPVIYGVNEGIFTSEGLTVKLFCENNFVNQINGVISGNTPYIRGTLGMINAAADALREQGQELTVFYQHTFSTGGDVMVVRPHIKKISDIKVVLLQLYGPHMDYVANIFKNAGVPLSHVKFRYLRELTLPTYNTNGKIVDPVSAFQADPTADAVMCISPDAATLTSGGKVGTGSEGSVKGARQLVSTKTASKIIVDTYTVVTSYYNAHQEEVQKLTHALLKSQELFLLLQKNKGFQLSKYQQVLARSAKILLDSDKGADVEGLISGDCEFVGYAGNVAFFTGKSTTRTFKTIVNEIQTSFISMGLMTTKIALGQAEWDYAALAVGLMNAKNVPQPKATFNKEKVEAGVSKRVEGESTKWAESGTLFQTEILFGPRQTTFEINDYKEDFAEAMKLADTYSGSLIIIEGHADPTGIAKAKRDGQSELVVNQMQQDVKNKSLERAREAKRAFLSYCKKQGITIDDSRLVAVGLGIKNPKFPTPKSEDQWNQNRRVVFRMMNVEGESTEWSE